MHEQLLAEYEQAPERIARAIAGVPDDVMARAPSPDAWSIREILVHLSDAEIVYAVRLRRALAETGALIPSFDESAWGDTLHYAERDPDLALTLFSALRRANADLLRRLSGPEWDRTATHSEAGPMTVAAIVQALVDHAAYHLAQIEQRKGGAGS